MKTANTCDNWTSAAATGVPNPTSWNAAHASQGCSAQAFINTGGRGSIFCFATNCALTA